MALQHSIIEDEEKRKLTLGQRLERFDEDAKKTAKRQMTDFSRCVPEEMFHNRSCRTKCFKKGAVNNECDKYGRAVMGEEKMCWEKDPQTYFRVVNPELVQNICGSDKNMPAKGMNSANVDCDKTKEQDIQYCVVTRFDIDTLKKDAGDGDALCKEFKGKGGETRVVVKPAFDVFTEHSSYGGYIFKEFQNPIEYKLYCELPNFVKESKKKDKANNDQFNSLIAGFAKREKQEKERQEKKEAKEDETNVVDTKQDRAPVGYNPYHSAPVYHPLDMRHYDDFYQTASSSAYLLEMGLGVGLLSMTLCGLCCIFMLCCMALGVIGLFKPRTTEQYNFSKRKLYQALSPMRNRKRNIDRNDEDQVEEELDSEC